MKVGVGMDSLAKGTRVAVVGAGPAGIVLARYLLAHGLEPTLFEQSNDLGGQWHASSEHSGVWPEMRTNTSRVMTCFSDMSHDEDVATYPHNREMQAYLRRYANRFGVTSRVRLNTRVERISESPEGGYEVSVRDMNGVSASRFDRVVVASGRFNKPAIPEIPGLSTFPGTVLHSFDYKKAGDLRGKRVLVCGCSISALEIAGDLAMSGAASVYAANRRQRYIVPKLAGGIPAEHFAFSRWGAYAAQVFPPEMTSEGMKRQILAIAGSPEQYGALKPDPDIRKAGIALSQHYLPLVAEGRIKPKPWLRSVQGSTVTFADETSAEVDAILLGTGFTLNMPFLSDAIRQKLALAEYELDLFNFSFSPELDNFAVLAQYFIVGPFFPTVELQARYIAYTWAGLIPCPTREEMLAGMARDKAMRTPDHVLLMHMAAIRFARLIGAEPMVRDHPELARHLMFGPLAPISFRISGPDKLEHAKQEFLRECARFGCITSPELTPEQSERMRALENALARSAAVP